MDLTPAWPGAIPLDTNFLQPQRNAEIAIGFALQAAFGTGTIVDGLACTQTTVASLSFVVGPGSIIVNTTVDTLGTGFGSLALDNTDNLVKIGINLTATTLGPLTAPGTAGQSQNFLVEAAFSEADGSPVTLPFYNAANPAQPYSGPANSGATSNTARTQRITLQIKAGSAATTGSQTTPAPDSGFVGLYAITVANGQTTITSGNIAKLATAPFIPAKLGPGMLPGFANLGTFCSGGSLGGVGVTNWTVPAGVTKVSARVWGAGGGSGGAASGGAGSGGGGGGYTEGVFSVTPGQVVAVTVGVGGIAGVSNSNNGGNGGASSFGSFCSATGGGGGLSTVTGTVAGVGGGAGTGGSLNIAGQSTAASYQVGSSFLASGGGGSFGASGTGPTVNGPLATSFPGGAGSGGANGFSGLVGAGGLVILEW